MSCTCKLSAVMSAIFCRSWNQQHSKQSSKCGPNGRHDMQPSISLPQSRSLTLPQWPWPLTFWLFLAVSPDMSNFSKAVVTSMIRLQYQYDTTMRAGCVRSEEYDDHLMLSVQRPSCMPSSHRVLTVAIPCWPGRQEPSPTISGRR